MEQARTEETMCVLIYQPGWPGARHWWCQNTNYAAGAPEIRKPGYSWATQSNEGSDWPQKGRHELPLLGLFWATGQHGLLMPASKTLHLNSGWQV